MVPTFAGTTRERQPLVRHPRAGGDEHACQPCSGRDAAWIDEEDAILPLDEAVVGMAGEDNVCHVVQTNLTCYAHLVYGVNRPRLTPGPVKVAVLARGYATPTMTLR